jgi:CTP-dependent riboflavin kinase
MRVLPGKVMSGYGIAKGLLAPLQDQIASRMGLPALVAGTLNVQLTEPYIVQSDVTIEVYEYKGIAFLKLKRCRINDMQCCIMRPNTHEESGLGNGPSVLEIMAPVRLRGQFWLHDGDSVRVEVEGDDDWWRGQVGQA